MFWNLRSSYAVILEQNRFNYYYYDHVIDRALDDRFSVERIYFKEFIFYYILNSKKNISPTKAIQNSFKINILKNVNCLQGSSHADFSMIGR